MASPRKKLHSRIGSSSANAIKVHGLDLTRDILGRIDLGQMTFLQIWGRLPTPQENAVFSALIIALVEHGLTPSVLAARLTLLGAPESLQAAVAAGLSGVGSVFVGSIEGAARMLQEAQPGDVPHERLASVAREIVARFKSEGRIIPGIGHPTHTAADPRTARLFEIAADNGFRGRHVALLEAIATQADTQFGRHLPVNVSGAIGAIASELGLDWRICRGIGLIARSIGLVGHLLEEIRNPLARELWLRVEEENRTPP